MTRDKSELRFHVALDIAGRKLRVELYSDGTAHCTACKTDGCEHITHARRLRDQPATVALEQIRDSYVTTGAWIDLDARAEWAAAAYRLSHEGLAAQRRRDETAMYTHWRDTDPRTPDQLVADAVAQFNTPGSASWDPGASPLDITTAHLGPGSTYDPAIHQET